MDAILQVEDLTKHYPGFTLDHVSFSIPKGTIMGLIGENGSGKSTTIKSILGLTKKDGGTISILGNQEQDIDFGVRNKIGVVFDGNNYPEKMTPKQLSRFLSNIYTSWDEEKYFSMLARFSLPSNKKIKTFSCGMKMKLAIVAALSQNPELLIMDEPTSGLDPVMRDDILDVFLEFVQDENHSIMMSSHITTDLEKVADYITFIHQGKVIFSKKKDELRYHFGIIRCGASVFDQIDKKEVLAYRKTDYQWDVLVADKEKAKRKYKNVVVDDATIDDIMLLYVKGERS